jgi:hypothetical protein
MAAAARLLLAVLAFELAALVAAWFTAGLPQ